MMVVTDTACGIAYMHEPYTHISDYIRNVVSEIASAATGVLHKAAHALYAKKIQLTGAVSTPPVQLGEDGQPIVLPVTVNPDSHGHTAATISGGVAAEPHTAVLRTATGDIRSAGTSAVETGYKLANGEDLSTLLVRTTQPILSFKNLDDGTTGNVITRLTLTQIGNTLVLTRSRGYAHRRSA